MPSQGPNSPGSAVSVIIFGTDKPWITPSNCEVSDNIYTTSTLPSDGDGTEGLRTSIYGFSIPTTASISGILVEVERKVSQASAIFDEQVFLLKSNSPVGSDHSTVNPWLTTESYVAYGGDNDLWGTTWSSGEINDAGFGVRIKAFNNTFTSTVVSVDHIRITVYYVFAGASPAQYLFGK